MCVQVIATLNLPSLTSDIVNNGVAKGDIPYIWKVGAEMAGFSLISILAAVCNVFLAARTSQKLGQNLRSDVYRKVINFTKDEYDQIETSSLITRTTNDVVQIQNVAIIMLRMMLMAPIMLIGASFLAYTKDHQLTMIFLIVLPIMIVFVGLLLYFSVPLFRAMQTKTDKINRIFREGLTGVRVIRAFRKINSNRIVLRMPTAITLTTPSKLTRSSPWPFQSWPWSWVGLTLRLFGSVPN